MEKAIKTFVLVVLCSMFLFSCSTENKNKEANDTTKENTVTVETTVDIIPALERTEVRWMYMDDSLRNICRPLNFILPWMGSDEREIPDTVYCEITRLAAFNYFSPIEFEKERVNDSIFSFELTLINAKCTCEVVRYYKGNNQLKDFDGYYITEQVICNAEDKNKSPN